MRYMLPMCSSMQALVKHECWRMFRVSACCVACVSFYHGSGIQWLGDSGKHGYWRVLFAPSGCRCSMALLSSLCYSTALVLVHRVYSYYGLGHVAIVLKEFVG